MNRKSGVVLAVVLMVFFTITLIGTTLLSVVMTKARQVNALEKRTQAYLFARTGVEIARSLAEQKQIGDKILLVYGNLRQMEGTTAEFVLEDVSDLWETTTDTAIRMAFENSLSQYRTHDIVAAVWKKGKSVQVISAGNAADVTRIVSFRMIASGTLPVFDMAIFADGEIKLGSSSHYQIIGHVGTNSLQLKSIDVPKNAEIVGNVYFGPGTDLEGVPASDYNIVGDYGLGTLDEVRLYELPDFPDKPTLDKKGVLNTSTFTVISSDGHYSKITVDHELTIETGSEGNVRRIVIDELDLEEDIVIAGNGRLEIFVMKFACLSGSINKNGEIDAVTVYYDGDSENHIELSGNHKPEINGTFYIKDANLKLTGNSELNVNGLVIMHDEEGKHFAELKGTADGFVTGLFAPNSRVEMYGNSAFYGPIIAKEFDGSGGGNEGGVRYPTSLEIEHLLEIFPGEEGSSTGTEEEWGE